MRDICQVVTVLAVAVLSAPFLLTSAAAVSGDVAVLQGLDKVTARIFTFEIPVGAAGIFGTLAITVLACDWTPPEETPERAAYLEIKDLRAGEIPLRIFTGWMFASSPALNALEHPVYDVWVTDCRTSSGSLSE